MDGRFVAYYRVSTAKQGASGLGLEAQQAAVRAFLNGGTHEVVQSYVEVESGKNVDRPKMARAVATCRLTGATLLVARMDRLSRNLHFLTGLQESGVDFIAVDNPSANRMTVQILAAVAEAEGKAISSRTKAALAAAKARGTVLGGFRGGPAPDGAAGAAAGRAKADAFSARVVPVIREMQDAGLSLGAVAKALAEQGVRTARGGAWTAQAVKNVLARA